MADKISKEMRAHLAVLVFGGAYGYQSWGGASLVYNNGQSYARGNGRTLNALHRRGLVAKERAESGTWRYTITDAGREVAK